MSGPNEVINFTVVYKRQGTKCLFHHVVLSTTDKNSFGLKACPLFAQNNLEEKNKSPSLHPRV